MPPRPAAAIDNYVLVDHPRRGLLFITGATGDSFGATWAWSGHRWDRAGGAEVDLGGTVAQSFRGFYDAGMDAVVCCGLVSSPGAARSRTVRVIVTEDAAVVEVDAAGPTGPVGTNFDFGVVFGFDPRRRALVGLARERVWQRASDGHWASAPVDTSLTGRRWYPGSHQSVFDPVRSQVCFYWLDWKDLGHRLLGFDGRELREMSLAGVPVRTGAALASTPELGAALVVGDDAGVLRLGDDLVWGATGAPWSPPAFTSGTAAISRGSDVWLGPAMRTSPAGEQRPDHAFYRRGAGRVGPPMVGAGSAGGRRRLLARGGGALAVSLDWRTTHSSDPARELAPAAPDRAALVALATASDGPVGVAKDGQAWTWTGERWQATGAPGGDIADDERLEAAFDRDRGLVCVVCSRRAVETRVLAGGTWLRVADSLAGRARRRPRGPDLVFDTRRGEVVRFAGSAAEAFDGHCWQRCPELDLADVHPGKRVVVHDPATGHTLAICTRSLMAMRPGAPSPVGRLGDPPDYLEPNPWRPDRPVAADWTFDPATRLLTLWVDDRLEQRYELALGPLFDRA